MGAHSPRAPEARAWLAARPTSRRDGGGQAKGWPELCPPHTQINFFIFIRILHLLVAKLRAHQMRYTDYKFRWVWGWGGVGGLQTRTPPGARGGIGGCGAPEPW